MMESIEICNGDGYVYLRKMRAVNLHFKELLFVPGYVADDAVLKIRVDCVNWEEGIVLSNGNSYSLISKDGKDYYVVCTMDEVNRWDNLQSLYEELGSVSNSIEDCADYLEEMGEEGTFCNTINPLKRVLQKVIWMRKSLSEFSAFFLRLY